MTDTPIDAGASCAECGNDAPAEGFDYCLDCLEALFPDTTTEGDTMADAPELDATPEPVIGYQDDTVTVYVGDCLDVLRTLPPNSVHAVVTDPPYGLEFMGRDWDAPWKNSGDVLDDPASVGGFQDGNGGNPYSRSRIRYGRGGGTAGNVATDIDEGTDTTHPFRDGSSRVRYGRGPSESVAFQAWCLAWATECHRVLKPGGHILAFGGSRTWHRLASAIEDAGFEIRDSVAWMYAQGFPKSADVAKGVDRELSRGHALELEFTAWMRSTGVTSRQLDEVTGTNMGGHYLTAKSQPAIPTAELLDRMRPILPEIPAWIEAEVSRREAAKAEARDRAFATHGGDPKFLGAVGSELATFGELEADAHAQAAEWQGWGTALKPAFEPIVVGRKPLTGTVARNVLAHGVGGINVDGCRVPMSTADAEKIASMGGYGEAGWESENGTSLEGRVDGSLRSLGSKPHQGGRWPTNVVLDDVAAAELNRQAPANEDGLSRVFPTFSGDTVAEPVELPAFHYEPKAGTAERPRDGAVAHPTVKPLDLMRWLVRLVTPPGGIVLEPFAGSGTTAEACVVEGFRCIAVELTPEYVPLIVNRLTKPIQPTLDLGALG